MKDLRKRLSVIVSFSKAYRRICDDQKAAMGISRWDEVLNDWWLALRFFFDRAFYQGRRDEVSWQFEQATLQALKEVFGTSTSSQKRTLWQLYYQVGEKIYSLLLRDVVDLFGLSKHLAPDDFKYLQAVDTWVEQLANKLGFQGSKTKLAIDLAEACQKHSVNPIAFNQGAWYLGAHSFDVLTENIERIKPPK